MSNILNKVFWASVHISTVLLLLSSYATLTNQTVIFFNPSPAQATIVAGATDQYDSDAGKIAQIDTSTTMGLVNQYRAEHNLTILTEDSVLTRMANERADDMVKYQYFGHKNIDGKIFFQLLNERSQAPEAACENLSLSYSSVAGAPFRGWKNSPGHNSCMLDYRMKTAGYAFREYGESYDDSGQLQKHYLVVAIHGS
jgi:uncharacterized protein YkwD